MSESESASAVKISRARYRVYSNESIRNVDSHYILKGLRESDIDKMNDCDLDQTIFNKGYLLNSVALLRRHHIIPENG